MALRGQWPDTAAREFAGSLFQELGQPHSTINHRLEEFTEGWSSGGEHDGVYERRAGQGRRSSSFWNGVWLRACDEPAQCAPACPRDWRVKHIDLSKRPHLRHPRRLHGAVPYSSRGRPAHQRRAHRVHPAGDQEPHASPRRFVSEEINGVSTSSVKPSRLSPIPTIQPPDPMRTGHGALQRNQVVLNWY